MAKETKTIIDPLGAFHALKAKIDPAIDAAHAAHEALCKNEEHAWLAQEAGHALNKLQSAHTIVVRALQPAADGVEGETDGSDA